MISYKDKNKKKNFSVTNEKNGNNSTSKKVTVSKENMSTKPIETKKTVETKKQNSSPLTELQQVQQVAQKNKSEKYNNFVKASGELQTAKNNALNKNGFALSDVANKTLLEKGNNIGKTLSYDNRQLATDLETNRQETVRKMQEVISKDKNVQQKQKNADNALNEYIYADYLNNMMQEEGKEYNLWDKTGGRALSAVPDFFSGLGLGTKYRGENGREYSLPSKYEIRDQNIAEQSNGLERFAGDVLHEGTKQGLVKGVNALTGGLGGSALYYTDIFGDTLKQNVNEGYDAKTSLANATLKTGQNYIKQRLMGGLNGQLTGGQTSELQDILTSKWSKLIKNPKVANILGSGSAEFIDEFTDTYIENIIDTATKDNAGLDIGKYLENMFKPETFIEAFYSGAVGGATGAIGGYDANPEIIDLDNNTSNKISPNQNINQTAQEGAATQSSTQALQETQTTNNIDNKQTQNITSNNVKTDGTSKQNAVNDYEEYQNKLREQIEKARETIGNDFADDLERQRQEYNERHPLENKVYEATKSKPVDNDKINDPFFKEHTSDFDGKTGTRTQDGTITSMKLQKGDNLAKLTFTEGKDKIWIDELYIKNQKQGYGSEIVNALKEYANKNGKYVEAFKELESAKGFWDKTIRNNQQENTDRTSDSSFLNEQTSNTKLENRVSGDKLLDAQDLINEIKDVGANVDDNGYVTVYHQTTPDNAQKILDTGKMTSKEQAVFFSTSKDATQSEGRGTTKLEFKIPAEELELDDIFSDNADVKINLNGKKDIDVSNYLTNNNKAETIQEPVIQAEPEPNFEDIDNKINGDKEVKVLESVPKETKKPLKERARETVKKFTRDFVSKGEAVESLSRKQKNSNLNHMYDRLGITRCEAQEHIGSMQRDLDLKPRKNFTDANGKKTTMSLNGIREDAKTHNIPETTLNQYLAENRNVDTVKQGKPILNKSAEASLEAIQKIESEHPEIKRIAGNVWTFERNQLQDRVQSGLISEQFAKELLENNPHYVRIQRNVQGKNTTNTLNNNKKGVEVNRQIDTLKGSDADIMPIMESIAKYTEQVQQSMRMNQFGQELAKTLGVGSEDSSISSFTDDESFGVNPNLLQDDGNGNYTLTVFNDGVATVVPIDQGLYESLTPNKTVQTLENDETFKKITYAPKKVSEMFRAVTTNQNPIFMFTNAFKDIGDAPFNSKYTGEFIKAYTSTQALRQVAGNGVYNQLYEAAGGKQNSYFNNGEFVDKTQTKAQKVKDKLLMPIEKGNDIVESVPRMAEFIATIKANGYEVNADGELVVKNKSKATKSANDVLNEALYNAAEVTTNFKRGGDVAKMLNRNGATFLNASIQGFDKQVRNFTQVQTPKEAVMLLTKALIFGIAPTMLNDAMWDDDDEYEELQDYLKDNYYLFKGKDGQWIRIPKGRAMSVIGSAFRRTKNYAKGDKDAFKGFGEFAANQVAPNSVVNNNIFAPLSQVKNNKSWSGNKIISDSMAKRPSEEQYNEKTDKISIALGKAMKDLPLPEEYKNFKSPLAIHYLLDQYTGVFGDAILPMFTEKSSSKYNPLIAPFIDKFTTDSVYSNKSVSEYYDKKNEIETQKNSTDATPLDVAKNSYMTSRNYALSDLYKEQKQIQSDSSLSKSEKYDKAREKQKEINKAAKQIVKDVENAEEHEYYVKIGDYYYKKVVENGEVKYKRDTSKKIPTDKYALYDYYKEKYEKSKEGK